ncbi:hypothetical protein BKI52_33885 [marine bacterium AO1-C]|nr:hypothetical protein BKI52_33885 [marine bacterium AO1-C]
MSKVKKVLESNPNLCNHFRKHRTVFIDGYGNASFIQKIEGIKGLSLIELHDTRTLHKFPDTEEIYFLIETDQPWFFPVIFSSNHSVAFTDKGISIVADGKYKFNKFLPWTVIKEVHLENDQFVFATDDEDIKIDNQWIYRIENKENYRADAEIIAKIMHLIAAQHQGTDD